MRSFKRSCAAAWRDNTVCSFCSAVCENTHEHTTGQWQLLPHLFSVPQPFLAGLIDEQMHDLGKHRDPGSSISCKHGIRGIN
jgi:hypothetical protein